MSVKVEMWGEYASFNRPELKSERYSYEVPTPSAVRGALEGIFWHPGLKWIVDKIYVLSPIEFTNIRRNEVKSKIKASSVKSAMLGKNSDMLYINTTTDIQQRANTVLKNVHYVVEAHFEMTENKSPTDNPGKFQDQIKRRLKSGRCYHQPYFGCREFPVRFREWEFEIVPTINVTKDLGFMFYDFDYSDKKDIKPMFFKAQLNNGVLDLTNCEVYR